MADLSISLGVETAGLDKAMASARAGIDGLKKAASGKGLFAGIESQVSSLQGKFSGVFQNLRSGNILGAFAGAEGMGMALGGVAVAAGTIAAAVGGMWDAMSRSKELNIMAEEAQVTVPQLMVLEKAFTRVGGSIENVPMLMSHLNQFLAEAQDPASKAAQALQKVGMSVKDFEGKSFYDIVKQIAAGMDKATDSATRFALASSLGGIKKAAITQAALKPEAIAKAEANVSPTAKIYEEQGAQFREFQTNIGKLGVGTQSFFAGVSSKVIPELIDATRGIERMEPAIVNAGKAFGSSIAGGISLLKDGWQFVSDVTDKIPGAFGTVGLAVQALAKKPDMAMDAAKSAFGGPMLEIMSLYDKYKKSQGSFAGEGSTGGWGPDTEKNVYGGGGEGGKPLGMPALIASSFTKIGAGGQAWGGGGGDAMMSIQREQLSVQQRMANALERQLANERQTGMGYDPSTTPLLGD